MRYFAPSCLRGKTTTMIKLLLPLLFLPFSLKAQECEVLNPDLKGTYTGECKKGKAHGKGKAEGKDKYEGDFRSGLADGTGTYTWNNGNQYTGAWAKGKKEGKGKMTIKLTGRDSLVEGYWKKDVYIGKHEFPYTIYAKSKSVGEVEVEYIKDGFNQITFYIQNTSGGASGIGSTGDLPIYKVDEVQLQTGAYGRLYYNDNHTKKSESILTDMRWPARMKVIISGENIEIEFHEAGSYKVTVTINE